uniref:Uncharacterized protein n=1 Tax=Opuntia streptacantha TaxID=393608 RepID=A0A7C9EAV7_OPUST
MEESGAGNDGAGRRRCRMCSMPFSISRRFGLFRLVYWPMLRFIPLVEDTSSNDFPITRGCRKMGSYLASSAPRGGDGIVIRIVEAGDLRPNSGVEDADDDVGGVVGVGPEAVGVGEAEEVGGTGGVEAAGLVGDDGEDGGMVEELGGVFRGKLGGEGGGGVGVGVEEVSGG